MKHAVFAVAGLFAVIRLPAQSLIPDPDDSSHWGKFPAHIAGLFTYETNTSAEGHGGVDFGYIDRGTYENPLYEVFIVNRRPDIDVRVTISTYAGESLSGSCLHMTYRSLGFVRRQRLGGISLPTTVEVIAKAEKGGYPSNPFQPPTSVAEKLSEGQAKQRVTDWTEMADRIKQAPKDLATEAVIKFIFGEAVSKVAGRLSLVVDAITPRMAADGTITGQVEGWKQRCETFLVQEVKREAYARYLLDQQRIIQYRLRTEQLPQYQYNMLLNAAYQANAIADNEFRTLRSNVPATVWCNNFLPKAKAFLNPKKTSSDDTDRVILP